MNWVMDDSRDINVRDFNDLFDLYQDSTIYAIFQLRFQQLLLGKLTVLNGEDELSDFGLDVVRTQWMSFIHQMATYFFLFGFCPYVIVKRKMLVTDADKVRESHYGETYDPSVQYVEVDVPIVPVRGTYRVRQRIQKREQVLFAVNLDGSPAKDIRILVSNLCPLPDWMSGKLQSEGAVLLPDWRRLRQYRNLRQQVDVSNALPPIVIQRHKVTMDGQVFTELQAAHVMNLQGNLHVTPNGFVEADNRPHNVSETRELSDLHSQYVDRGVYVSRSLLTHQIPDGFEHVPNVPVARLDGSLTEMVSAFEEKVAGVMRVPLGYIRGRSSGGGGAPLIQNEVSTDNERIRLINNVTLIRNDLAVGLKTIWLDVYGEEDKMVHFHIPLPTTVELKSVLELLEYEALPDKVVLEEVLGILNIEHKRLAQHVDLDTHRLKRFRTEHKHNDHL